MKKKNAEESKTSAKEKSLVTRTEILKVWCVKSNVCHVLVSRRKETNMHHTSMSHHNKIAFVLHIAIHLIIHFI